MIFAFVLLMCVSFLLFFLVTCSLSLSLSLFFLLRKSFARRFHACHRFASILPSPLFFTSDVFSWCISRLFVIGLSFFHGLSLSLSLFVHISQALRFASPTTSSPHLHQEGKGGEPGNGVFVCVRVCFFMYLRVQIAGMPRTTRSGQYRLSAPPLLAKKQRQQQQQQAGDAWGEVKRERVRESKERNENVRSQIKKGKKKGRWNGGQ